MAKNQVRLNKNVKDELGDAVKHIIRSYKKYGQRSIDQKLNEIITKDETNERIKKEILKEVGLAYSLHPETIMKSNKRGSCSNAKATAMLLFHKHINISQVDIANIFKRAESLVSRRIRTFNQVINGQTTAGDRLVEKMYCTKEFITNYNWVDRRIKKFCKRTKK